MSSTDALAKMSSLGSQAGAEASLRTYKLLEAFGSNDTEAIASLLQSYDTVSNRTSTPLHLAVKSAKAPIVETVLQHSPHFLNVQDAKGSTPLHFAANLNRIDVVDLLLNQAGIDDSIIDDSGASCTAMASPSVVAAISASRAAYTDRYLALLSAYISAPPVDSNKSIRPPISVDPSSPSLVSAASGHFSNVAAENLYHFIAQPRSRILDFGIQDSATGTTILHETVRRADLGLMKCVLARGGSPKSRDRKLKLPADFSKDERIQAVLKQANADTSGSTRASMSSDRKLVAPTLRGYLSKWTNMAKGYRLRWFVLDGGILSYYRHPDDEGRASKGSISMSVAVLHGAGPDKLKFEVSSNLGKAYPSFWLKANHHSEASQWIEALQQNIEFARDAASISSAPLGRTTSASSRSGQPRSRISSGPSNDGDSILGDEETFAGEDETGRPPRADDYELLAMSTKTQLDLTQDLLDSLIVEEGSANAEVVKALRGSISASNQSLAEYVDVSAQRERYFIRKYEREIEVKRLWEENMKELAASHSAIEAELVKVGKDNIRKKRALQDIRANISSASPAISPTALDHHAELDSITNLPPIVSPSPVDSASSNAPRPSLLLDSTRSRTRTRGATMLNPSELEQVIDSALARSSDSVDSESDDEEFFEAIEAGAIPLSDSPTPMTASIQDQTAEKYMEEMDLVPYKGYENLRDRLPIDNDNRPPVSLWAILKGSIGKDLSKISFPVFFNEPTSMLQRMSEDLEFSDCLDRAAAESDPNKRIAFVAAFAFSNYSSTIGRIAKPFNPMLGETFEYVDIEKKYRYMSQQVSHHPPISACIAQSPSWEYYGEVDAKSKFTGKSFEITPCGVAHVNLRILEEWSDGTYPKASRFEGLVKEHYSWKKVTTCVSNLLFTPVIDHYGIMTVTNHRTGLQCILNFKARGWRNSGAMEVKGKVVDSSGHESWDIAGRWSDQLIARKRGAAGATGEFVPDSTVPSKVEESDETEYVRLWKNSVKPPGSPFNLTPFAIRLNDTNDELKAWLPPTDCRLRPDQHAFESGEFEKANALKAELEEHQRATRKARERGEKEAFEPRWFKRKVDKDTGEGFWEAVVEPGEVEGEGNVEYWAERKRVGLAKREGKEAVWKGVDPIFADL